MNQTEVKLKYKRIPKRSNEHRSSPHRDPGPTPKKVAFDTRKRIYFFERKSRHIQDMTQAEYNAIYRKEKKLGEGGYGSVDLVEHIETGKKYAAKRLLKLNAREEKEMIREFEVLNDLKIKDSPDGCHPNINCPIALIRITSPKRLVIAILELATPFENVVDENRKRVQREYVANLDKWLKQALRTLQYIHRKILHNDIKMENMLISASGDIQFADVGLSCYFALKENNECEGRMNLFAAPVETIFEHRLTKKTDHYALGVMFYEAYYLKDYAPPDDTIYDKARKGKRGLMEFMMKHWTSRFKDSSKRPTWVTDQVKTVIMGLTHPDENKRMTPDEALSILG